MGILKCFSLFIFLFLICACKSSSSVIKGAAKETSDVLLSDGWIDSHTFRTSATGYPKSGISTVEAESSAYTAAYNLAMTKIEYAILKEMPKGSKVDDAYAILEKYKNVESYRYVDKRYVEIVIIVSRNNLLPLLRDGDSLSLLK